MAPSLRDLPYEERLLRLKLPTLVEERERGDVIAVYRARKGVDKVDREDLFVWDQRDTRGYGKKLKRTTCRRDTKKYSFPYRSIEILNNLDAEVVHGRNINEFKAKLDNKRYGDGTVQA